MIFLAYSITPVKYLSLLNGLRAAGHHCKMANPRQFDPQDAERADVILLAGVLDHHVGPIMDVYQGRADVLEVDPSTTAQELLAALAVTPPCEPVRDDGILEPGLAPVAQTAPAETSPPIQDENATEATVEPPGVHELFSRLWPYVRSRGGVSKSKLKARLARGEAMAVALECGLDPSEVI